MVIVLRSNHASSLVFRHDWQLDESSGVLGGSEPLHHVENRWARDACIIARSAGAYDPFVKPEDERENDASQWPSYASLAGGVWTYVACHDRGDEQLVMNFHKCKI